MENKEEGGVEQPFPPFREPSATRRGEKEDS